MPTDHELLTRWRERLREALARLGDEFASDVPPEQQDAVRDAMERFRDGLLDELNHD